MSANWCTPDLCDMEPSIRNFRGNAHINKDLTSLSWLVSCPFSGGFHTGSMRVNGKTPKIDEFRWQPYQALRKVVMGNNVELMSSTRMVIDENVVMWNIEVKNNGKKEEKMEIEIDHIGFISKYEKDIWEWWYPFPNITGKTVKRIEEIEMLRDFIGTNITKGKCELHDHFEKPTPYRNCSWPSNDEILDCKKYKTKLVGNKFVISDFETDAITVFEVVTPNNTSQVIYSAGGVSSMEFILYPPSNNNNGGKSNIVNIQFIMAFGDDENEIIKLTKSVSSNFDDYWNSIESEWNFRWEEMFKPNNSLFSGAFPSLELENDDENIQRVFYNGALTLLYLFNTHLPQHKKVFMTGGPRWGGSTQDTTLWSNLWAMVDPVMMKEQLRSFIKIDLSKAYGVDQFSGKGVGVGYVANYWAIFQMIRGYVTITGEMDFLKEIINGKPVIEHIIDYSLHWKEISIYGKNGSHYDDIWKLASFGGDPWNLLECVPTYIYLVPSFNVGYVWMMREAAKFLKILGDKKRSEEMNILSQQMLKRVLQLYSHDGYWYSLYPNGSKVDVRHCLDFIYFGVYLADDLPDQIKKEMVDFAYRELITDHWMRALSKYDQAAQFSDRPDHGPLGAYDGWPAGMMDALSMMGYSDKSYEFYKNIVPVTFEGGYSQSHELWGKNKWEKNSDVRISKRGWANRDSAGGISISHVMIKNFFGFYPSIDSVNPLLDYKIWPVQGKLLHVKYKGEYYSLIASPTGVKMIKEE